jgi:hypothetical protein
MNARISTVVAGLFWILAAQMVGSSAAAPGTTGAGSSATLEGRVQIHVTGRHTGPELSRHQPTRIAHGRFTLFGALSDRETSTTTCVSMSVAFASCSARGERSRSHSSARVRPGESSRGRARTPGFEDAERTGPHSPSRFEITMTGRVSQ